MNDTSTLYVDTVPIAGINPTLPSGREAGWLEPMFFGPAPTGRLLAFGSYKEVTDALKANGFFVNYKGIYGKAEGGDGPKVIELRVDHANKCWHAYSKPGEWDPKGSGSDIYKTVAQRRPRRKRARA